MTNHNDPIERAMQLLHIHLLDGEKVRRTILTDLAAELKREFCREIYNDAADLQERCDKAEARLAAVVEFCEQIYYDHYREQGTDNFYHGQFDVAEDILAIARGERKFDD